MTNQSNGTMPGLNTPANPTSGRETAPEKRQHLADILAAFPGTTSETQCQRLLEALSRYSLSTFELSRYLDIYHPPARVMDLRDSGVPIVTNWITTATESGERHRVGLYVLAPETKGGING